MLALRGAPVEDEKRTTNKQMNSTKNRAQAEKHRLGILYQRANNI
jgi:hypothetical protein